MAGFTGADPVRVQITTGGHPYDPSFYSLFEHEGLSVTVNPHPSGFLRDLRKSADVLVLYDLADTTGEEERRNLEAFLESGRGLVVLHHAIADNWQWKWWYQEVVGGRFLMGQDGEMPRSAAKANEVIRARPVADHPILKGVGTLNLLDETYNGMWISPNSRVLMETDNPNSNKPVVWIGPWRKSRVAVIQLGHGPAAHRDPGYRKLVHNAILWAAGRLD
ncbi:MAG: ThuA domain-containing protein [Acidobacteria bacterium]|nr:ThuA domain-containing protein [Acidobacteriota bacterium]